MRAAWKEDLQATPAEMVYGEPIRLPGQFLNESSKEIDTTEDFVARLRKLMSNLQPRFRRHGEKTTFIYKDLATTKQVFLRHDAPSGALQPLYDGPYEVLNRGEKTFKIRVNGRAVNVSVDRLKPAYTTEEREPEIPKERAETDPALPEQQRTRSGRLSRPPVCFQGL